MVGLSGQVTNSATAVTSNQGPPRLAVGCFLL